MNAEFLRELTLYLEADYPLIFIVSQEERRARNHVRQAAAAAGRSFVIPRKWGTVPKAHELLASGLNGDAVMVIDSVHRELNDPRTLRILGDLASSEGSLRPTCVVIAPQIDLPLELERLSAVLDLPLPAPAELLDVLNQLLQARKEPLDDQMIKALVRAAQGLTEDEAQRAFQKALIDRVQDAAMASQTVMMEKRRALRKSRVLEYAELIDDIEDVGGLDRLKDWLSSRRDAFTERARAYGLPAPRGLLLMGVQGCGKSLTAKAIARYWQLPLVRLDIGAVFGSMSPESALKQALKISEAMAPVVLWIDEIEKGFDQGGRGPAARLLGGMVTWLQEKRAEVFVVATANRVSDLPPELPRKGRFDEIFFVDLPNIHERRDILRLHLKKRDREPSAFKLDALAKKAERLTGSELEQLIISAMYKAFARNAELSDGDLQVALKETVPLYDTFEDEIKKLREWARYRARPASTDRSKIDFFAENSGQTK